MNMLVQPATMKDESNYESMAPDMSALQIPTESVDLSSNKPVCNNFTPISTSATATTCPTAPNSSLLTQTFGSLTKTNFTSGIPFSNSTTPILKTQKSFNPTESFFSSFATPPLNPTSAIPSINSSTAPNPNPLPLQNPNATRINSSQPLNHLASVNGFSSVFAPTQKFNATINPINQINNGNNANNTNNTNTVPFPSNSQYQSTHEQSDVVNFTNHIFQQPYLFFHTPNMHIPGLEASQDELYTIFTFLVPNKPFPSSSSAPTSTSNSQLLKNTQTPTNSVKNSTPLFNNNYTHASQTLNSNIIQPSIFLTANGNNGVSPSGFQKREDNTNEKTHRNSLTGNTHKLPVFGIANIQDRKPNVKPQSLVDIIKQQCNPEEEKKKKQESTSGFSSMSGFKNGFNPQTKLSGKNTLPVNNGLSQSSITSLLNLSLSQMNAVSSSSQFGSQHNQSSSSEAMENEEAHTKQEGTIIKQEIVDSLAQQNNQQQTELPTQCEEEVDDQVILADSNEEEEEDEEGEDEEEDDEDDEDDSNNNINIGNNPNIYHSNANDSEEESDKNEEDEEARLIREIKEMKRKKLAGQSTAQLFARNLKKEGGLLFGGCEGQEGDIFDFCDEKFIGGGKKQKKNAGGGHKNKFDTKNLVKNFLNSFISFAHHPDEETAIIDVLALENSPQLNDFRSNLRNFFKGKKFNRVLLKEFIFEDLFRPLFLFFLENRALNWIESGRMKDKASHLRALKNFIFVCQHYDQIKSWRFRYNFVQN